MQMLEGTTSELVSVSFLQPRDTGFYYSALWRDREEVTRRVSAITRDSKWGRFFR